MIAYQLIKIINWKQSVNTGYFKDYKIALAYMNKHSDQTFELKTVPYNIIAEDKFVDEFALEH